MLSQFYSVGGTSRLTTAARASSAYTIPKIARILELLIPGTTSKVPRREAEEEPKISNSRSKSLDINWHSLVVRKIDANYLLDMDQELLVQY